MNFDESEDITLLRRSVSEFMKRFPEEYWRRCDENREFPQEYWEAAAQNGLLAITIPEEYGGAGLGMYEAATAMMEVAKCGGGLAAGDLLMRTLVFGGVLINRHGTKEAKEKYLPKLASGQAICSLAHTEPNAGVNTFDIQTRAEKRDGGYVVNGQKIWITLAHKADFIVAVVRTTPKEKAKSKTHGISVMIIDTNQEGVKAFKIPGMAMRALTSNTVYFEDAYVPEENVIGEIDKGWACLTTLFNAERISTSSISLGCGEYVLNRAVDYAKNRIVFGRPIGSNQAIQFPLAEAKAELEVAKLMTLKAAWLFDQGRDCAIEANIAALQAGRAALKAADRAIQTYGGMGFAIDNDIERFYRDVRLFKTAPVPEEMVLNLLATRLLQLPRSF